MSNYIYENSNTKSFYNMAWIAFAVSSSGMILGLIYMPGDLAVKGFLAMSYLFTIVACFTLSKVIRVSSEMETL